VGELERSRAVYELAIKQPVLDMPELLWKSYIDFEIEQGEVGHVRQLYERLLDRTKHIKVWLSFAAFEATDAQDNSAARAVYSRASEYMKQAKATEERVLVVEAWYKFELNQGADNASNVRDVAEKRPRRMKKKRIIEGEDGATNGWEEYVDYVFPDDDRGVGGLKLLENAAKWKAGLLNLPGAMKRKAEALQLEAADGGDRDRDREEDGAAARSDGPAPIDDAELNID